MTDVAFPKLTVGENVFKGLVYDNAVEAGLAALFAYAPFLAVPPLKQGLSYIVKLFADRLFEVIRIGVDIGAIQLRNAEAQRAYLHASVKLKLVARAKGIDSPEFRAAREEDKRAFAKFVRFGATL